MQKISFIVICYNLKCYIERCLQSILNQSLKDIEIIIVDDGSTDVTLDIINRICKGDSRVKIIVQKNKGANAARKTGLKQATGDYVIFVDGDDWLEIDIAKELYNLISKEQCDIIEYGFELNYDDSDKNEKKFDKMYKNVQDNKFLELLLLQKIYHCLWNKIYRRTLLLECKFDSVCNTSMGEDLAANILIAIKKPKVKIIKNIYYHYYQRDDSTMNKITERLLEIVDSTKYIEDVLMNNNLYEDYKEEIEYLWFINCYYYNIICANTKHNKYHKQLFHSWKNKKINIYNNKYCSEVLTRNIRIIDCIYNINYYFGDFVRRIYKIIEKCIL